VTQPTITPAGPVPVAPRNGFGVTALVLGIVGAVFSWVPVLGLILAVLAVVFGALGYARARKGQATNSGMAIAGLVLGIIAFLIQIIIFAAVGGAANQVSKDLHTLPAPFPPNAAVPARPAQSGPLANFGDGTYVVGKEVLPGTYKTTGSANGFPCYWARLKDTSGDFNAIITNGNPTGPTTVTISQSDGAFQTVGCNTWQKVG
jgi:hypothetical protein